jgi:hypothetical protein
VRDPAPPAQQVLYTFEHAADLARWRTFSDQELGGKSVAELKEWPEHPVRGLQTSSIINLPRTLSHPAALLAAA